MNEFNIRRLIYILIAVLLSVLAVKLFIWSLPIILIVILASYIYRIIKRININIKKDDEDEVETIKRSKKSNTSKSKTKKIIIIDEENNE